MLFIFIIYRIVLIKNRCIIFQCIWHIDLIKMQSFWFFVPYLKVLPSVALKDSLRSQKELGVRTLRARFALRRVASPQNKKLLISLKIFSIYLKKYILQFMFLFYSTFSRLRGADFVKVFALLARFAKSASI